MDYLLGVEANHILAEISFGSDISAFLS